VNEDLTRTRAEIARKARELVKQGRFDSSWVTNDVILIKLRDGSVTKVANPSAFQEACESTRLKFVINLSQDSQVTDPTASPEIEMD
jgi:hypothetical protein